MRMRCYNYNKYSFTWGLSVIFSLPKGYKGNYEAKFILLRTLEIAQGLESAEAGAKHLKSPDAVICRLSYMT